MGRAVSFLAELGFGYRSRASVHSHPGHRTRSQLFLPRTRGSLCEVTTAHPATLRWVFHWQVPSGVQSTLLSASRDPARGCPTLLPQDRCVRSQVHPSDVERQGCGWRLPRPPKKRAVLLREKGCQISAMLDSFQRLRGAETLPEHGTRVGPAGGMGGGGAENHFFVTLLWCHANLLKQHASLQKIKKCTHTTKVRNDLC